MLRFVLAQVPIKLSMPIPTERVVDEVPVRLPLVAVVEPI